MRALIVVDAQNEFSASGQRAVPGHAAALAAIQSWVAAARMGGWPIAWVQHHNRPFESRAFVPGTWGAALSSELDPRLDLDAEQLFVKEVFGAFSATSLGTWLRERAVREVVVTGFFAHMCVSTTVREALVRDFEVAIDPAATGAQDVVDPVLGHQSAAEVCRTAFLHLTHMGARIEATPVAQREPANELAAAGHRRTSRSGQ